VIGKDVDVGVGEARRLELIGDILSHRGRLVPPDYRWRIDDVLEHRMGRIVLRRRELWTGRMSAGRYECGKRGGGEQVTHGIPLPGIELRDATVGARRVKLRRRGLPPDIRRCASPQGG
jgi:hypothetical protein